MRLIDADDLLKKLCAESCGNYGEEDCAQPERCYFGQMIEDAISAGCDGCKHNSPWEGLPVCTKSEHCEHSMGICRKEKRLNDG